MKQEFDHILIKRIREGDEKAFSELVNHTLKMALNISSNILYDRSEADDAVQESYIKVWRNIDSFEHSKGNFLSWFIRILRNECIDRNRKSKSLLQDQITENMELTSDNFEAKINLSDIKIRILKISEKLPNTQRTVFILRDIEGLSIEEVAEKTGLSEGSIKSNLYLARKKIRIKLKPAWR